MTELVRIGVCGGRRFRNKAMMVRSMDDILKVLSCDSADGVVIVHGGAIGARRQSWVVAEPAHYR
jgi:hypothetical protein